MKMTGQELHEFKRKFIDNRRRFHLNRAKIRGIKLSQKTLDRLEKEIDNSCFLEFCKRENLTGLMGAFTYHYSYHIDKIIPSSCLTLDFLKKDLTFQGVFYPIPLFK